MACNYHFTYICSFFATKKTFSVVAAKIYAGNYTAVVSKKNKKKASHHNNNIIIHYLCRVETVSFGSQREYYELLSTKSSRIKNFFTVHEVLKALGVQRRVHVHSKRHLAPLQV
jgi:hypothetical protein